MLWNKKYGRYHLKIDDIKDWSRFVDDIMKNDTEYKQRLWKSLDIKTQNAIVGKNSKGNIDKNSKKRIIKGLNKAFENGAVINFSELRDVNIPEKDSAFFGEIIEEMDPRDIHKINRYLYDNIFFNEPSRNVDKSQ